MKIFHSLTTAQTTSNTTFCKGGVSFIPCLCLIKSPLHHFFKHQSVLDLLNNRFSKSISTSAPSLNDMESNDFETDTDNEVELDKLLSIE